MKARDESLKNFQAASEIEPTEHCCDVWPKIMGVFAWFSFDDAPGLLTMPNVRTPEAAWRVNFCPACGKQVRDAIVTHDALEESRRSL